MLSTRKNLIARNFRFLMRINTPHFSIKNSSTLFSRRLFATDAGIKKIFQQSQIVRTSRPEPRASELIHAIRAGNYKKAELLISEGVNVNGHNDKENTALTDAAKRGDEKGVEFLLKRLKANPSASCDCPDHKTGLHYASEEGHVGTVRILLNHGANPNVLDKRNYTAIDVAKNPQVKRVLEQHLCLPGEQIEKNPAQFRRLAPK